MHAHFFSSPNSNRLYFMTAKPLDCMRPCWSHFCARTLEINILMIAFLVILNSKNKYCCWKSWSCLEVNGGEKCTVRTSENDNKYSESSQCKAGTHTLFWVKKGECLLMQCADLLLGGRQIAWSALPQWYKLCSVHAQTRVHQQ